MTYTVDIEGYVVPDYFGKIHTGSADGSLPIDFLKGEITLTSFNNGVRQVKLYFETLLKENRCIDQSLRSLLVFESKKLKLLFEGPTRPRPLQPNTLELAAISAMQIFSDPLEKILKATKITFLNRRKMIAVPGMRIHGIKEETMGYIEPLFKL